MGTWGTGPFENDEGSEWLARLLDTSGFRLLSESLEGAEIGEPYLQAPHGVYIRCAAEVVAGLLGRPSVYLPAQTLTWLERHRHLDVSALVERSVNAIDRLMGPGSELEELWRENESDYRAWKDQLLDLRARLVSGPA